MEHLVHCSSSSSVESVENLVNSGGGVASEAFLKTGTFCKKKMFSLAVTLKLNVTWNFK